VIFWLCTATLTRTDCPAPYVIISNGCYNFEVPTPRVNWSTANSACAAPATAPSTAVGHLLALETASEATIINIYTVGKCYLYLKSVTVSSKNVTVNFRMKVELLGTKHRTGRTD
jgi:hypothetical protein